MNQNIINEILNEHKLWLKNNGGKQADLSGANLSGANLSGANLRKANLSYANLSYANLSYANLRGANFSEADLSYADLSEVDLNGANFCGVDFRGAYFSATNLICVNYGRHTAYYQYDGMVRIGCEYHSIEHWLENAEAIATDYQYTNNETKLYIKFIEMCNRIEKGSK